MFRTANVTTKTSIILYDCMKRHGLTDDGLLSIARSKLPSFKSSMTRYDLVITLAVISTSKLQVVLQKIMCLDSNYANDLAIKTMEVRIFCAVTEVGNRRLGPSPRKEEAWGRSWNEVAT
jgi:hypothetical protein